jgi:bifunctional polynucleotide phosphatase/kinase
VGIEFKTPEEFFLNQEAQPFTRLFDPSHYIDIPGGPGQNDGALTGSGVSSGDLLLPYEKLNGLDIVLLCGSPAAGKSTFYRNILMPLGYERINQDMLKTVCFD